MTIDRSQGWDAIAGRFVAARSGIGVDVVRRWSERLPCGAAVLDVGCGSGVPVSEALVAAGFEVFGIDASPTLVALFRRRFPEATVACEAAEHSRLFDRKFSGAVAIGLLFLLPARDQRSIIGRIGSALEPGGQFLFSAPREACEWADMLTGRRSQSLGLEEYRRVLGDAGMQLRGSYVDEGGNHYLDAGKSAA